MLPLTASAEMPSSPLPVSDGPGHSLACGGISVFCSCLHVASTWCLWVPLLIGSGLTQIQHDLLSIPTSGRSAKPRLQIRSRSEVPGRHGPLEDALQPTAQLMARRWAVGDGTSLFPVLMSPGFSVTFSVLSKE